MLWRRTWTQRMLRKINRCLQWIALAEMLNEPSLWPWTAKSGERLSYLRNYLEYRRTR